MRRSSPPHRPDRATSPEGVVQPVRPLGARRPVGSQTEIRVHGDLPNVRERVDRGRGMADEAAGLKATITPERVRASLIQAAEGHVTEQSVAAYEGRRTRWMQSTREFLTRRMAQGSDGFILSPPSDDSRGSPPPSGRRGGRAGLSPGRAPSQFSGTTGWVRGAPKASASNCSR